MWKQEIVVSTEAPAINDVNHWRIPAFWVLMSKGH